MPKDKIVSLYGNGTGAMVIRTEDDGTKHTVHTGTRLPKAKTSYKGKGHTNVGDPMSSIRVFKSHNKDE